MALAALATRYNDHDPSGAAAPELAAESGAAESERRSERRSELGQDVAVLILVCSAAAWIAFGSLAHFVAVPRTAFTRSPELLLSLLTSILAGSAGVLCLQHARLTPDRSASLTGAGLLIYGVVHVGFEGLVRPIVHGESGATVDSLGVAWAAVFVLLVIAVLRDGGDVRMARRWRVASVGVGATAAVAALVVLAGRDLLWQPPATMTDRSLAAEVATAIAWIGLAAFSARRGFRRHDPLLVWLGLSAAVLAEGRAALLLSPGNVLWLLQADVFRTLSMVVALLGALRASSRRMRAQTEHLDGFKVVIRGAETRRQEERRRQDEVVHDLLSALTAVGGAAKLLSGVTLSEDRRRDLGQAVQSELRRVQSLVTTTTRQVSETFVVYDVILPVAVCSQAEGLEVSIDVPGHLIARGHPGATAEIVRTLLDNAGQHAPGTPVEIVARADGSRVSIAVRDRGPGIPAGSETRIFERGWTTDGSGHGQGLGLFVAARLADDQDGRLSASSRGGGGAAFYLELPQAHRWGAHPGDTAPASAPAIAAISA